MTLALALLDGEGPLTAGDLSRAGAPIDGGAPATLGAVLGDVAASLRDDPGLAGRVLARLHGSVADLGAAALAPAVAYLLAQARVGEGRLNDALVLIDEARAGHLANGDALQAARTNLGRTHVLYELGRHAEALDATDDVLRGLEAAVVAGADPADTHALRAVAHMNAGICHEFASRYDDALDAFGRAAAAMELAGDSEALADVVHNRAYVLMAMGRVGEATAELRRAAELFESEGARARWAVTLVGVARGLVELGEFAEALDVLARAGNLLGEVEADHPRYDQAAARAEAYASLNLLDEAADAYRDINKWVHDTDLAVERAKARYGLGATLARLGDDAASDELRAAAEAFADVGVAGWSARALIGLGSFRAARGDHDGARRDLLSAVEVAGGGAAPLESFRARLALAATGDASVADHEALYGEAVALAVTPLVHAAAHAAGRAHLRAGDLATARLRLAEADVLVERQRGALGHEAHLVGFGSDKGGLDDDLVRLELRDPVGGVVQAAAAADRAKSRSLLALARGACRRGRATDAVDSELEALEGDLHAVYRQMFDAAGDAAQFDRIRARAAELEHQLRRRRLDVRPATVAGTQPSANAVPASHAPAGAVVVERETAAVNPPSVAYCCLDDEIVAFVDGGTNDGTVAVPLPIGRADVRSLLARLDAQHGRIRLGAAFRDRHEARLAAACRAVLGQLHDALFAPVAEHLARPSGSEADAGSPLVVVPDDALHGVPFHALWDGSAHLVDRWAISVAPSLAMFAECSARRTPATRPALVVGVDDDLAPNARAEALAVAGLLDTTALVGAGASAENLRNGVGGHPLVHVATHAWYRAENPMFSAIRLADRWVTAAEVLDDLQLDGATVVLSACDTGRSSSVGGDELLGLVRGFLGAGAATLIASLWPADDTSTVSLMAEFHALLPQLGATEALRRAQLRLKSTHEHPSIWAPFVLGGAR